MYAEPLTREEREELRRRIDAETRLRGLPQVRALLDRERARAITSLPCRTGGCPNRSRNHHGRYAGLCDECVTALGHHLPLS